MARKSNQEEPRQAHLTADQMRAAIPRLRKRIEELTEIDVSTIQERQDRDLVRWSKRSTKLWSISLAMAL